MAGIFSVSYIFHFNGLLFVVLWYFVYFSEDMVHFFYNRHKFGYNLNLHNFLKNQYFTKVLRNNKREDLYKQLLRNRFILLLTKKYFMGFEKWSVKSNSLK